MTTVTDLPRLIPPRARIVLDAGCGMGALGAAYRRLNPRARLLGIDKDPEKIRVAAAHYDLCVLADLEADGLPFETPSGIDCIVYDDILEYLADPFAMLGRHAAALAPDGVMLISVINVEHWSLTERLLRGAFFQTETGPLARRHRQWFSRASMGRDLAAVGLNVMDARPVVVEDQKGRDFIAALRPALRELDIDPVHYAETALPRHFIWRVSKTPPPPVFVAANLLAPVGGVSHLRVLHPITALGAEPGVRTFLANAAAPPDLGTPLPIDDGSPDPPRIFILHRPALMGANGQTLINGLIEKGWLVVTEFDDHPDFLRGMNSRDVVSFRGVHAVQTTTPTLAAILRQRNPEVALFPNAIASLPPVRNFTDPRMLTVFFGALNREPDWRPIIGAINDVAARAGDRLRFRVLHDEGFYHALETRDKSFTPLCDYDTYLDLLGTSEVSLMPLDDTPFNRAKSDLKFIEAGACRVASLASAVVYQDSIVHGETGLIFSDPEEFHRQFLRLTAIPDLALTLGMNARRMVTQDRMLVDQVAARLAWYRDIWSRRGALTQALRRRIEGLPLPEAPWS